MARPVRIQVKQLKELQAAIKRGGSALEAKVVSELVANALELIRKKALENLLFTFKTKTGNLQRSLVTQISRTVLRGKFGAWTKAGGKKQQAAHAHLLEYGHRIVGHKPGKKDTGKTVQGKPFFRPAVDSERGAVRRMIRKGLQDLLAKGFGFGKPGNDSD